jgi:hypothetical protein
MQLFRLFCLYFPTKEAVKHGNVDEEEQLKLLVSYKKCLLDKLKTEKRKGEFLRKSMKDKILETLFERNTKTHDELTVYDVSVNDPLTDLEYPRIPSISEVLESEQDGFKTKYQLRNYSLL